MPKNMTVLFTIQIVPLCFKRFHRVYITSHSVALYNGCLINCDKVFELKKN